MNYIILDEKNPEQAVKVYSSELFKISRPVSDKNDVTQYLFGWITHKANNEIALAIDLDYDLKVHPEKNISVLVQMINSKVTEAELLSLTNYVNEHGSIKFGSIIPSTMRIYNKEELSKNGWFIENI